MRIVFLSRWLPYPADNGSKIRIFNILKQLSRRNEVSLCSFAEATDEIDRAATGLASICLDLRAVPNRPYRSDSARALAGFFALQPRSMVDSYSPAMAAAIDDACRRNRPELIVASQVGMIPYALRLRDTPAILEELELATYLDATNSARSRGQRLRASSTWLKLKSYLGRVLHRFAACTVASEAERAILRGILPDYSTVKVIPNAVDLPRYAGNFGLPRPNTLIFSGALTYDANFDGLRYFLAEVFPLIRQAIPSVELRVTGRTDGVDLGSLPKLTGVQFTGYLDDVRPIIAQSWVSVVPLRLGGGTRLKILEAMALGTPVVSTSKGVEGLDVVDGESVLIANEPAVFARRVIDLIQSPVLRGSLAACGRRVVATKYDWHAVGPELDSLIAQVGRGRVAQ